MYSDSILLVLQGGEAAWRGWLLISLLGCRTAVYGETGNKAI